MTWWLESPWPSLLLGAGLETVLGVMLVRTGRAVILGAMVGVLALVGGLLLLERLVVTDTEAVEESLDRVAAALSENDAAGVLAGFSPTSPMRRDVQAALARVKISSARVAGDLEVRFNKLGAAPTATAYFTGIIDAKDKTGSIPYEHMIRRFKVTLHKEGDRWLIFDYSERGKDEG